MPSATTDRTAFLDALDQLPAKHKRWLSLPPADPRAFELFCFHGLGIVVNDAQNELARDIFMRFGDTGTIIHTAAWANRTGKTTGVTAVESYAVWRKWRLSRARLEDWLDYRYQWLHAAPTARLTSRGWEIAEAVFAGRNQAQISPITNRPRPAVLAPFYKAISTQDPKSRQEQLLVECANGAKIDYFSTHDGAGRLESETWWGATWDEFGRHQPIEDIPLLIDQTFLPRVSDFEGPILLSTTATEDNEYILMELEDRAAEQPHLHNFRKAARSVNFAMSSRSIQRQIDLSLNSEAATRSVQGQIGVGSGKLFPPFLLDNAFRKDLPERPPPPRDENEWAVFRAHHQAWQAFDHGLGGDENVIITLKVPWPYTDAGVDRKLTGQRMTTFASRRSLTPAEQHDYLRDEAALYRPTGVIIDATAEGGLAVFRTARAAGLPAIDCNFAGRAVTHVSNKEYGIQALQEMFSYGLEVKRDESGRVTEWPEPLGPFGLLALPASGEWLKLRNQLATLRRDDEKLRQDRAMTLLMLAWHLWKFLQILRTGVPRVSEFNVMANRRRR